MLDISSEIDQDDLGGGGNNHRFLRIRPSNCVAGYQDIIKTPPFDSTNTRIHSIQGLSFDKGTSSVNA